MSTFDWENFYDLAKEWDAARAVAKQWDEARCRCIVSRAYYSVWNLCREYADANTAQWPIPAMGNAHDNIIQWFYRGKPQHRQIASNLDRLKKVRVQADYQRQWSKSMPPQAAADALLIANRILNDLGGL